MARLPLSVVVCTLDEEAKIARMLRSVAFADEVVVLDSGSTDRTCEIARAAGASVHSQAWRGFSQQKNDAARLARHDWVLSLDADEIVDDDLQAALVDVLSGDPDPRDGWAVDRRGDFLGALLPNSSRPAARRAAVRLYHRGHSAWDEAMPVHEVVRVPGVSHPLPGTLLHVNGLHVADYVALFSRYAGLEADALREQGAQVRVRDLTLRPVARFVWHLAVKGEWRLGRRGLVHAGIKSMSDFLRYARLLELELGEAASTTVDDWDSGSTRAGRAGARR